MVTNSFGSDRKFLNISSKMTEPFCSIWHLFRFRLVSPLDPTKFENCDSKIKEIAVRTLIVLGGILGSIFLYLFPILTISSVFALGALSKIFRIIGFHLQKGGFTHVKGSALEKSFDSKKSELKVVNWNICGVGGGLSIDHGGVVDWRSRIDSIVEKIKGENPDVLVLEEIYDTALAEALIAKLESTYAHFFIHLGPNTFGSVSGSMIITKYPIHNFTYIPFSTNNWTLNRGFGVLELKRNQSESSPFVRIVGTHLIHGEAQDDIDKRKIQLDQIVNSVSQLKDKIPTLLASDSNIERDGLEGAYLSTLVQHSYQKSDPTCTNYLVFQWDREVKSVWGETIDNISVIRSTNKDKRIKIKDSHLIKAFDETYNTKTAISDHHGISSTFKIS